MRQATAALLVMLAASAGASAVPEPAPRGRALQQTAADCARGVANCRTCRYSTFRGRTTTVCTGCNSGYMVALSGRACWCSPGFWWNATAAACSPCGAGNWCAGSRMLGLAAATRNSCGAFKTTSGTFAQSERECVVLPGYGWQAGDAVPCARGTYNFGWNARACMPCTGGLTTANVTSTSPTECVAPAGYYFARGKAIACAQGTFKNYIGNGPCVGCPTGFTTPPGTVAMVNGSGCSRVMPGYGAAANLTLGVGEAEECDEGFYRTGTAAYNATMGVPCTACPANMTTLPGTTAATSPDVCLAPPGFGWNISTGDAAICAIGFYNEGWNRLPCRACDSSGGEITTPNAGAEGTDECMLPAGYGSRRSGTGYTGFMCPPDSYGRDQVTYGLAEITCAKCPENSNTRNASGATSSDQCMTEVGFSNDGSGECDYGFYYGGDKSDCLSCGEHFNTTAGSGPTLEAITGANSSAACAVAAGWTYAVSGNPGAGLKPCVRGTYKALIGDTGCSACPNGTTTTITMAATALSDCNACRPGFGVESGNITDLSAPACGLCPSGTYSTGFSTGGETCKACPKPSLFSGTMVSRAGASNPDQCVGEFASDADKQPFLTWNRIPMVAGALTVQSSITTIAACQAACAGNNTCQYFEFYSYNRTAGEVSQCYLRLLGEPVAADPAFTTSTTGHYIMFEVSEGRYAVYKALNAADAQAIGTQLATHGSFASAKFSCEGSSACTGFSASNGVWRTFAGERWEGVTGKVRVVGATLNSWVPDPQP